MSTRSFQPAVAGLDGIAAELTELVLNTRATLPHALNGRPIAPSDPYAANVLREMKQGRSQEMRRIYAVLACALRDGAPFCEVVAVLRRLIALLEVVAVAGALRKPDRPIPTLARKGVKEFAELTSAEMILLERPNSPDALAGVLREAQDCAEVITGIESHCERALAHLTVSRGIERPLYGQRHTIEVAR